MCGQVANGTTLTDAPCDPNGFLFISHPRAAVASSCISTKGFIADGMPTKLFRVLREIYGGCHHRHAVFGIAGTCIQKNI